MKRFDLFDADRFVQGPHGGFVLSISLQGISGGEDVAGIEADAQAVRILDAVQDGGQVLEPPAEVGSLSGGGLQETGRIDPAGLPVDFIQGLDDLLQSRLFAAGRVGARMGHDVRNPQPPRPLQFHDKGIQRFFPEGPIGAGEVDQVGVVSDRMGDLPFA